MTKEECLEQIEKYNYLIGQKIYHKVSNYCIIIERMDETLIPETTDYEVMCVYKHEKTLLDIIDSLDIILNEYNII